MMLPRGTNGYLRKFNMRGLGFIYVKQFKRQGFIIDALIRRTIENVKRASLKNHNFIIAYHSPA